VATKPEAQREQTDSGKGIISVRGVFPHQRKKCAIQRSKKKEGGSERKITTRGTAAGTRKKTKRLKGCKKNRRKGSGTPKGKKTQTKACPGLDR